MCLSRTATKVQQTPIKDDLIVIRVLPLLGCDFHSTSDFLVCQDVLKSEQSRVKPTNRKAYSVVPVVIKGVEDEFSVLTSVLKILVVVQYLMSFLRLVIG